MSTIGKLTDRFHCQGLEVGKMGEGSKNVQDSSRDGRITF
jgi:hypothetical protein